MRHTVAHKQKVSLKKAERTIVHSKNHFPFKGIYHHLGGSEVFCQVESRLKREKHYTPVAVVHYVLEFNLVVAFLHLRGERENLPEFKISI